MRDSVTDLAGRRALVTGGSRGLGLAIANRLARANARIAIIDHPDGLASADLPDDWITAPVDLASATAESDFARAVGTLDQIDILVANAGVVPAWRSVTDLDMDEWDRVFRINVAGIATALKAVAQPLSNSPNGSAVLMASINAYRAHPSQILYTATKHAVVGLMRAAAQDLGRHGVRVNALAPGPIATDALMERIQNRHIAGGPSPEAALSALAGETALGRMATKDDVAGAALYLASDLSAGVTGTVLPVECGIS
ncbi:MAG: SDR family oxidoreductase [Hyphomicrobiales bacterium]|nr:SDR family oxidoreductase [Hyphomicrobiales bacterium]MCP4998765.1 SDR family oxidoreductase [Hyphomicrobiales bacterium]